MSQFVAAAIQMNSQPDLAYSMDQGYRLVKEAVDKGARFVGLPENFAFLGDEREKHRLAEPISRAVYETLPDWSREFGIYLMAGGFPVRAGSGKVYNTAMMLDPNGETIALYNKIHLFDVSLSEEDSYRESELVEAGKPEVTFCDIIQDRSRIGSDTDVSSRHIESAQGKQSGASRDKDSLRVGLSICYDIRFPELYRHMADQQVDLICVPAAFTRPTGEAHWEPLLRARAIENCSYVIAPAQTGLHGKKRKTYGHSMIIDPWGRIKSDAGSEPGIITTVIDTKLLEDIRNKLPSLQHRVL